MNKSDIRSLICTTFSDLTNNIKRGAKVVNCLDAKNHMCPFSEYGGMLRACEKEIAVAEKDLLDKLEKAFGCTISCDGLRDLEQRVEKLEPKKQCPRICPFNNPYEEKSEEDVPCNRRMRIPLCEGSPVSRYETLEGVNYTIHSGVILQRKDNEAIKVINTDVDVFGSLFHATLCKQADVEVQSGGRAYHILLGDKDARLTYIGGKGSAIVAQSGNIVVKGSDTYVTDVVMFGGKLTITDSAHVTQVNINSCGSAYIVGAKAEGWRITSGGSVRANSATMNNVEIQSGGFLAVTSAALIYPHLPGGSMSIGPDTVVHSCYVSSGGRVDCIGSGTTMEEVGIRDGHLHMESGSITGFTVYSSGDILVSKGTLTSGSILSYGHVRMLGSGLAQNIVLDGGKMELMGGVAGSLLRRSGNPTASAITVESCGQFVVGNSASLTEARVATGGAIWIWPRGSATDVIIQSGGTVIVSSGAELTNCRVDSGGELYVQPGGHALMDLNGGLVKGNMPTNVCQKTYEPKKDEHNG